MRNTYLNTEEAVHFVATEQDFIQARFRQRPDSMDGPTAGDPHEDVFRM